MVKLPKYWKDVLVAYDKFLNALFWGDPRETMSSRMGRLSREGKGVIPCILCKLLNLIQKNHCIRSIKPIKDDTIK